jgi:hypothetical protein
VLHRAIVDTGVDADLRRQVQQALLLATNCCSAGAGRHEQRLDAERITRAEQFLFDGVPQCEREHAAQPGQRVGAPVVVRGDDGLAVTVGVKDGTEIGAQRLT